MLYKSFQSALCSGTGNEQVDIADRFLPTPQTAGRSNFVNAVHFAKVGYKFVRQPPTQTTSERPATVG